MGIDNTLSRLTTERQGLGRGPGPSAAGQPVSGRPRWKGQRGRQDQPSVGHQSAVVEGDVDAIGMNIGKGSRYKVTSPDDPALSEMEQIDAIIERSVTFEMTEAHHDNIGLKEIDLDGEMSGGDIPGPMVARIEVDPLSTIEGHPRWQTGQELIEFLDSDPNVFRGEFDGNRWQGMGVPWVECPANIKECFDRLGINDCGNAPHCPQCDTEVDPEETHFHILDDDGVLKLCERCWSKGPLPEEDQTLELEFQGMTLADVEP